MAVVRHYMMTASEGRSRDLLDALTRIRTAVIQMPGCDRVDILHDTELPDRFVLIEQWDSIESHQACLAKLPQELVDALLSPLADPLEGQYLSAVA